MPCNFFTRRNDDDFIAKLRENYQVLYLQFRVMCMRKRFAYIVQS